MALRAERLEKLFWGVVNGKRAIHNLNDSKLLLEAVRTQQDCTTCVAALSSSHTASLALRQSLCIDLSEKSLNEDIAKCLLYLTRDEVLQLHNGQLLHDLLTTLLKPPLLWNAYNCAAAQTSLSDEGLHGWARLVLSLLILLAPASEMQTTLKVHDAAQSLLANDRLLQSQTADLRLLGHKLSDLVRSSALLGHQQVRLDFKAGGRHDNDFDDFRQIAIFPTTDELLSKEPPYILPSDVVLETDSNTRVGTYLANQFRLLREDWLAALREDLARASSAKKSKKRPTVLRNLQISGVNAGVMSRLRPAAIAVKCWDPVFKSLPKDEEERKKYFIQEKNMVRHGAFGCLNDGGQTIAFATINRDEDLLAKTPPIVLLQFVGKPALHKALVAMKMRKQSDLEFVSIDSAYFAYEPVLTRLQRMPALPLANIILDLTSDEAENCSSLKLGDLASRIREHEGKDLRQILHLDRKIQLDHSQTSSLTAGLEQKVSLIQGPPGTGKSFIGAMLSKAFIDNTNDAILVLCYTNHALDQFLEDIMDMGVPGEMMLRLGSKSTARTLALTLREQKDRRNLLPQLEWRRLQSRRNDAEHSAIILEGRGASFSKWTFPDQELLDSLEFSESGGDYFAALTVPGSPDGMTLVDARGHPVKETYLLERWKAGRDAGIFQSTIAHQYQDVWSMAHSTRQELYQDWMKQALFDQIETLGTAFTLYDDEYSRWSELSNERTTQHIKTKRLVGCTTTAAAKYAQQIEKMAPGIVLVEEAGEVLESHVLTAITRDTKQLVLIGDHLQLRPKANNYKLTVEAGEGYDLNRSLFERLVHRGHPHTVLRKQHRMRPEISALVRRLMYPTLQDDEKTLSRHDVRGLQSNVIFIQHDHLETSDGRIKDSRDGASSSSHQNEYEAQMVLKIVRYLAQQGYGTQEQVVLTPYLGQLQQLVNSLKIDHDPVLNDLDSADLVKAGLLTFAGAQQQKRPLRVSTVDNFQGEESRIVIVSLTRSNPKGDIGFLKEPQRLNVLLSRARDGLIIVGNANTFRNSKKGRAVWDPFFDQLVEAGYFFDGLPVVCQKHPEKRILLKSPTQFDQHCPSGGCELPCGAELSCKKHQCPEKCHPLVDHSKMKCTHIEETQCPKGHKIMWQCWEQSKPCRRCDKIAKEIEAKRTRDLKLAELRAEKEAAYQAQIQALDDEIFAQRQMTQDRKDEIARQNALEQKQKELEQAKRLAEIKQPPSSVSPNEAPPQPATNKDENIDTNEAKEKENSNTRSEAAARWEHQKVYSNASNEHLDALMRMIGLESVKQQLLNIKDKIDLTLRQGASIEKERFGVVLLGNPGTGKTTVARIYAKCLASMGAVPGTAVEETTASRLSNGGVAAFQKLIEKVLNSGGGAIFIDEAYQLASQSNGTGSSVLDALLDESENLVGKVVFILAGYKREMESFYAHNPGLPSRFPNELVFEDFTDDEILEIFQKLIKESFANRMKAEGGLDGLYCRIAARRVGRGRGRPGFGNARAVENAFAKLRARQAARLSQAKHEGDRQDEMLFTREDIIGPAPAGALKDSKAWKELQAMIGLSAVKESVRAFLQTTTFNYERELREEAPLAFNLNRVFLGSPGTGKTTVAKLYGQILADLGLLSNGQVVVKNPSDFVGEHLGASEKNTRGILSSSIGKVLVIDEAYGLYSGSAAGGGSGDIYKTSVIDTLVAEVQSIPGEDRCVLLLGYRPQMEAMMQNVNPGLSRRFPLSEAFQFDDFSDDELEKVARLKLKQQEYTISAEGMTIMMAVLQRARNKPNFGNGGEVDILLNMAKERHQKRLASVGSMHDNVLEASDFDPDFERMQSSECSVRALFEGTIGNDELIARLERIQMTALALRKRDLDPRSQVPFNFIFTGPPGTGKTTTARKMGTIYYNMGILGTTEVIDVSASELVGQYMGHTGPKTQQLLEKGLGKVLFIDEAYRLAEGQFAKEAIDELVDRLTKPQFAQRLIVILAGYTHDMQRLMSVNPGLSSRFPEVVEFRRMQASDCLNLLMSRLAKETYLDTSILQRQQHYFVDKALSSFSTLIRFDDWANARDVETLARNIARDMLVGSDPDGQSSILVAEQDVLNVLERSIDERQHRAKLKSKAKPIDTNHQLVDELQQSLGMQNLSVQEPQPAVTTNTTLTVQSHEDDNDAEVQTAPAEHVDAAERDVGVSDQVWCQLQLDKKRAADQEDQDSALVQRHENLEQEQKEADETESRAQVPVKEDTAAKEAANMEKLRQAEQERIQRELRRREREEELERLRRARAEVERRRAQEQKAQQKLRQMGVCVAGFRWTKQPSGYRCAGGSHYVSNSQLGFSE